jgi:hypothetical protein
MSLQQQTVQERFRPSLDGQEQEPVDEVSPNTERMGVARALGQGILQNGAVRVGVGVLAAAGAGLVLVSMAGVGATAVAGAAGYLAYHELTAKRV